MGIKIIFSVFIKLKFGQILVILGLLMKHPLFAVMTFIATLRTFKISEEKYPKTHHRNGRGNAFRHTLWCCLIMMYCCKISSSQKSLRWCKKITDLHEDLFVNDVLLRAMDLHNNQIGMDIFMEKLEGIHRQFFETLFFTDEVYFLSQNARLISSVENIQSGVMVIIENID